MLHSSRLVPTFSVPFPPAARNLPSGENASAAVSMFEVANELAKAPLATVHSSSVPPVDFSPPDARRVPSGENAMESTCEAEVLSVEIFAPLDAFQSSSTPPFELVPPAAIFVPSGE